jgi:hypothetical protein
LEGKEIAMKQSQGGKKQGAGKSLGQIWFEAVEPVAKKFWPEADNDSWGRLSGLEQMFLNQQAEAFLDALKTAQPSVRGKAPNRPSPRNPKVTPTRRSKP